MSVTAMKTYWTRTGYYPMTEERKESLQVRVRFQAEMSDDGWRPPYRLRNVDRGAPTGFAWGYSGTGPLALAWTLLTDALSDIEEEDLARLAASEFCDDVVAKLEKEQGWEIHQQNVLRWFGGWKTRQGVNPELDLT